MTEGYRPEGDFARLPRAVTVREVTAETATTRTLTFDMDWPAARPGQFLMAWLPDAGEGPFCIADNTPLKITVSAVGFLTKAITALEPGDRLWLRGPLGQAFPTTVSTAPLLVGGGYGAAPLVFLARTFQEKGVSPRVVIGGRGKEALLGRDRFAALGIVPIWVTEDGSEGETGRVTEPVTRILSAGEADALFAVGPNAMLEALAVPAKNAGVPAHLSRERHMGCGMGLCGMCEDTDGALLCVEGPVRSAGEKESEK